METGNRIHYFIYEQKKSDQIRQQSLIRAQQTDLGIILQNKNRLWFTHTAHLVAAREFVGEESGSWFFIREPYEDLSKNAWLQTAVEMSEDEDVALELQYRSHGGSKYPPSRLPYCDIT